MELYSERFKEAVKKAVEGGELVMGTVHWRVRDKLIEEVKAREYAEIFRAKYENRGSLHEILIEKAVDFLARTTKE